VSSTSVHHARFEIWRLIVVYVVIVIAFGMLLYRLLGLQIFQGQIWLADAVNNYTRSVSLQAARGIIYDRNGYVLARNVASYNIVITPADLPDADADIQRIYRELSQITGVPVNQGTVEDAKNVSHCIPGPVI
jgi:penicillin-binding protein 2